LNWLAFVLKGFILISSFPKYESFSSIFLKKVPGALLFTDFPNLFFDAIFPLLLFITVFLDLLFQELTEIFSVFTASP
jgi:hypothetical protein